MNADRVLYLTARELTVHRLERGHLMESFAFSATPEGMEGFSRYLGAEPHEATLLLTDLIEEEFCTELLPHVTGSGQKQLHARHAQRLFRTTPFRASRVLSRVKTGRQDDRVLFSALTNPELLAPWVERINDAGVPLLGISSVAQVTTALPRKLGLHATHLLLVSEEEGAGLRQTFFLDSELRVSRLSPTVAANIAPRAGSDFVYEEIVRTQRYLQRLQLLPFGAPLHVAVLCEGERVIALENAAFPEHAQVTIYDLVEAHRLAGVAPKAARHANGLFVQLFAREARNRYAQATHLHHRNIHWLRRSLELVGMLAGVTVTLLAVANVLQTIDYRRATSSVLADTARQQQLAFRDIVETLPSGLNPEQLHDAVESAEQLAAVNMRPRLALGRVGRVLQDYPEFVLQRLQWAGSANADFSDLEQSLRAGGEGIAFLRPTELADAAPGLYHGVIMEGQIAPFDGGYRNALNRLDDLVDALRQVPDMASVEVVTKPLEVSARISGSAGSESRTQPAAPFALRMVFRL